MWGEKKDTYFEVQESKIKHHLVIRRRLNISVFVPFHVLFTEQMLDIQYQPSIILHKCRIPSHSNRSHVSVTYRTIENVHFPCAADKCSKRSAGGSPSLGCSHQRWPQPIRCLHRSLSSAPASLTPANSTTSMNLSVDLLPATSNLSILYIFTAPSLFMSIPARSHRPPFALPV